MAFVGSRGNAEQDPTGVADAPPPPTQADLDRSVVAPVEWVPDPQRSKRASRLLAVGGTVALGAACLYTAFVDPNNPSNAFPQCPLKAATGIDCPGCGGLRATHALLHGDILGAADHNILALVLLPIMAYMFVRWVLRQFDVELPTISWPRAFVWITPLVLVLFTIGRNISIPGLYWLNSGTYTPT
jgi:hypothetical protein